MELIFRLGRVLRHSVLCLIFSVLSFVQASYSQCTPELTGPDFEAVPDTIVNLPTAYYPAPYEATIQMYIPTDTFVDLLQLVLPLDSLFITGIDGLPPSFEYQVYPSPGPIPGGTPICLQITNSLVYEEVAGSHPLFIHVTAWSVGLPANGDITGYVLNVEPLSVGITELETKILNSNVVTDQLTFTKPPEGPIEIIGTNGKLLIKESNTTNRTVDVSALSNGIYFLRSNLGTARFVKVSP